MKKSLRNNIIFLIIIALVIIPQIRKPIQVLLHKGLSFFTSVETIHNAERVTLNNHNWKLINENGDTFGFEKIKGKVTVINFWATWCPPCIAEMPSLQKLYSKYKDDVEFLFITSDTKEIVKTFKAKNNYMFPVFQAKTSPPNILKTKSIPRTLIINKRGDIVIDKSGAVDWFGNNIQKEIDNLLKSVI